MQECVRSIPNFPKQGVTFKDINPILQNSFPELIDSLSETINVNSFDFIVGIESRGFILASALAYKIKKGFVPIRKKGKLPPPTVTASASMEYANVELEMTPCNSKKNKVLLIDDILATGNTLQASWELCKNAGYDPIEALVLGDLPELHKGKNFSFPVKFIWKL